MTFFPSLVLIALSSSRKAQASPRLCCSHSQSMKTHINISELRPGLIRQHVRLFGGLQFAYAIITKFSCTGPFGPRREKILLRGFANNKGADLPAHPRSLISAFVIRLLESVISKLVTSKIAFF